MDVLGYFNIIKKRALIIFTLILTATVLSGVISIYVLKPVYHSSTVLYVATKAEKDFLTFNNMQINTELINDYRELIKSRTVNTAVIEELGLTDITADELSNKIDVTFKKETRLLVVSAENEKAQLAMDIANKVAEVFKKKVIQIMNVENVQIIDLATLPHSPFMPNIPMNIGIGALIGLMLGFGIAFMLDYFDNTIKTAEDVKVALGLPILGSIPRIKLQDENTNTASYKNKNTVKSMILTHLNSKSSFAEAYRIIRTNIEFSSVDKPVKMLLFTSTGPKEGKSTTSLNTAIAFAKLGKKTLLIDCDLRKPKLHKLLKIANDTGLLNILLENSSDYKKYIKDTNEENLEILTTGIIPPNPSEIILSKGFREIIAKTRDDYDMIIIDAPPVGILTDSAILSGYVDGTIYVVAAGESETEMAKRALEHLKKVNSNVLGIVLNKVEDRGKDSGYYLEDNMQKSTSEENLSVEI